MKRMKSLLLTVYLLASAVVFTNCGSGQAGVNADMLDVTVSSSGIILPVASQSCVDIQAAATTPGTGATSLATNSIQFYNFSINWKRNDFDLNLPSVTLTVISNRISGGQVQIPLLGTEIEKLLGAKSYTLSQTYWTSGARPLPAAGGTPVGLFSSRDSSTIKGSDSAGTRMYPCGLGAGGITLADPKNTSSFTATVRIDLVGVAVANAANSDPSAQKVVRKSITTTARFY